MYKCNNCGAKFARPMRVIETHGLDTPPYERIEVCPCCQTPNIDEYKEDEEDDEM